MTAVICGGSFDVDWLTSVVLSYDSLCSNTDLEAASQRETSSWYQSTCLTDFVCLQYDLVIVSYLIEDASYRTGVAMAPLQRSS
jgi:hypothetical protein